MSFRIPLAKPEVTDSDREAVMQVLCSTHLSMGPKLHEFEKAICEYTGSKYAVAVNSGTSALQLAVRALNLKPGSEVILPSFTFSALLNVVLQERLRPRFVDVDPGTYNVTPDAIAAAITPRTRLVLAVHTFGFPMDVIEIQKVLRARPGGKAKSRRNARLTKASARGTIHIIEDACEALGAEVHGQKAGTLGAAGVFAFYPNKQITTGEGGMLVTSDTRIAAQAERLRNQGREGRRGRNQQVEAGFSYRISDINCALGFSQLSRIESVIARRQKLAETYDRALAGIPDVIRPALMSSVGRISWFVYPVRIMPEFRRKHRDWLCESLARKGIATGRYFAPLHRQPVYRKYLAKLPADIRRVVNRSTDLRNTEAVADRVLALPFFNGLTESEIYEVAGAIDDSIRELRRKI